MPPNMPTTKMSDKMIGRVEVGNIYDAIKLADDEAGDPNINIRHVKTYKPMESDLIKLLNGNNIPVAQSKYMDSYMLLIAFSSSRICQRMARLTVHSQNCTQIAPACIR